MEQKSRNPRDLYSWAIEAVCEEFEMCGFLCDLERKGEKTRLVFNREHLSLFIDVPDQDDPENIVIDSPFEIYGFDDKKHESPWKKERFNLTLSSDLNEKDLIRDYAAKEVRDWLKDV